MNQNLINSVKEVLKLNPANYDVFALRKEVEIIREYLKFIGAIPSEVDDIQWNHRYTRKLGSTTRKRKVDSMSYRYILQFNYKYFHVEEASQLHDTIIHECIHLCYNCFDHGETFKKWANHFNQNFGTNIGRVNKKAEQYQAVLSQSKKNYEIYCNDCGRYLTTYHRVTQKVLSIARKDSRYSCPYCRTHNMRVTNLLPEDLCKTINLGTIRI